jgi:hypothetical protein
LKEKLQQFFGQKEIRAKKFNCALATRSITNSTNEIWTITIDWVRQIPSRPILPEEWRRATHGFLHEGL